MSSTEPTLQDVEHLAGQLGIQFSNSTQDSGFDLDRSEEPRMAGTYRKTQAGITTAYDDLQRYAQQVRGISTISAPAVVTEHLEVDCQQIPGSVDRFITDLASFLADQADPTGSGLNVLKIYNLRSQAQLLRMHFQRIDGLLELLEQRNGAQK